MEHLVYNKYSRRPVLVDRPIEERSCTVPDQSLSVTQILERFSVGLPPAGIVQNTVYDYGPDDSSAMDADLADDYVNPAMRQNQDLTDYDDLQKEIDRGEEIKRNFAGE